MLRLHFYRADGAFVLTNRSDRNIIKETLNNAERSFRCMRKRFIQCFVKKKEEILYESNGQRTDRYS